MAGVVALMLEDSPYLSPAQIEKTLEDNATPLLESGERTYYRRWWYIETDCFGIAPINTTSNAEHNHSGHGFALDDKILDATPIPTIAPVIEPEM